MLKGKEKDEFLKTYLQEHPDVEESFKGIRHHFSSTDERCLKVSDIEFITFKGWNGEPGIYAWYYPMNVPHYTKIGEK